MRIKVTEVFQEELARGCSYLSVGEQDSTLSKWRDRRCLSHKQLVSNNRDELYEHNLRL